MLTIKFPDRVDAVDRLRLAVEKVWGYNHAVSHQYAWRLLDSLERDDSVDVSDDDPELT